MAGRFTKDELWKKYWEYKKKGNEERAEAILKQIKNFRGGVQSSQPVARKKGCGKCGRRLR